MAHSERHNHSIAKEDRKRRIECVDYDIREAESNKKFHE